MHLIWSSDLYLQLPFFVCKYVYETLFSGLSVQVQSQDQINIMGKGQPMEREVLHYPASWEQACAGMLQQKAQKQKFSSKK